MGNAILPSVGRAQFEFILLLYTAAGVAVLGAAVLVSAWTAWEVLERASKSGHSDPLVWIMGYNA